MGSNGGERVCAECRARIIRFDLCRSSAYSGHCADAAAGIK
jgi:hypothetical protein